MTVYLNYIQTQELLTICELNNIEITEEGYTNEHPFLVISVSRDQDIPTILNRFVFSLIVAPRVVYFHTLLKF